MSIRPTPHSPLARFVRKSLHFYDSTKVFFFLIPFYYYFLLLKPILVKSVRLGLFQTSSLDVGSCLLIEPVTIAIKIVVSLMVATLPLGKPYIVWYTYPSSLENHISIFAVPIDVVTDYLVPWLHLHAFLKEARKRIMFHSSH